MPEPASKMSDSPVGDANFNAGRVAAELQVLRLRGRRGATHPPETDAHGQRPIRKHLSTDALLIGLFGFEFESRRVGIAGFGRVIQ